MAATALDVAMNILEKSGSITAMKLQKLTYYCQAWSLVWRDRPIFHNTIQAWANGPVVPELYYAHKGQFQIHAGSIPGSTENLIDDDGAVIDAVIKHYGDKSALWLSELTHMEDPWKNAREGVPAGDPSGNEITLEAMAEYYGSLV